MGFLGLSEKSRKKLQYEIISEKARLKLTRLIRDAVSDKDADIEIIRQNRFVNIARNVLGLSLYRLESDDDGCYYPAENAWHIGEVELIMRRPNTIELVETLADFLQNHLLDIDSVNEILEEDGASVSFTNRGFDGNIEVKIMAIEDISDDDSSKEHPNIRKLVERMDDSLVKKDYAAVLHASASIFETLAKIVVNTESIENQSLGSFFDKYRKESNLPSPILDYILEIFKQRNTEPLSGHGSRKKPSIKKEQAVILSEMTKSFVRIERKMAMPQIYLPKTTK